MRRKFTITVEEVYKGSLDEGYRAMAADEEQEGEALEWSEGLIGDVPDETPLKTKSSLKERLW